MRVAVFALIVVMLNVSAGSARALGQDAMPAFTLTSPAGAAVASSEISNEAHWLLIYVSTACGSCDRLLSALEQWRPTLPQGRIVVVIRGPRDEVQSYATRHVDAAGLPWYADADQQASRALGLLHEPALIAVENGRIAWVVTGVLNDPSAVEPVIRNWTVR
jgi:peroxiredoxin